MPDEEKHKEKTVITQMNCGVNIALLSLKPWLPNTCHTFQIPNSPAASFCAALSCLLQFILFVYQLLLGDELSRLPKTGILGLTKFSC